MKPSGVVFFLIFVLAWSVSAAATPSSISEIPPVENEEEVRAFIEEYKNRLVAMDLETFMALFSEEAVENRMLPYADIRESYRRTIARSRSLSYQVKINFIQAVGENIFVSGRYHLVQNFKRMLRARYLEGNIQWFLARENGVLKIREINYGKDR